MSQPVTVTDLACQRGAFRLGPVAFDVAAGGRLAIVGPSGSGKTTLLRCIAGLERATSGTIRIGANVVADARTHVAPDRRGLGLVFQDGALWSHMTALQHLRFAAPKLAEADALALLARAGLESHARRKPATFSGGEAQRLGLLRALAPDPAVLLLDEPLRSVDVHQRATLVLLLRTLGDERGLTTILVTHDRDEALALATDLVVLDGGRVMERGPAVELLQRPATAFTAAFLLGAACLPTTVGPTGRIVTPFGEFDRPGGSAATLRLVLPPGSTIAAAAPAAHAGPGGRVLGCVPDAGSFRVQVAFEDQLLHSTAAAPLVVGSRASLSLRQAPWLLPWQPS